MSRFFRQALTSSPPGKLERGIAAFLGISGLIWALPAFLLLPIFFLGFIFWLGRIWIAFGDRYLNTPLFWSLGIVWELAIYLSLGGRYGIKELTSSYVCIHSTAAVALSLGVVGLLLFRRTPAAQTAS